MNGERGFTVVEVVIAIMILSVGLLALVGTAASVTRMIGQGYRYSEAATMAAERIEVLRSQTQGDCGTLVNGSTTYGGYALSWAITTHASTVNPSQYVEVVVSAPRGDGTTRADTFTTTIPC